MLDVEFVQSRTRFMMRIVSHNFRRLVPGFYPTALFVFLISCISPTNGRRNITVDSNNSLISYTPLANWTWIVGSLDAGGGHMLTEDPNAYALINLTFISYWIMSTRWPYHVTTQHTIDNSEKILIDLQDHTVPDSGSGGGSKASAIVARYIGSSSRMHTIRVSVPPGDKYAVLDRLIFEVDDTTSAQLKSNRISNPTQTVISSTASATRNTSATIGSASDGLSATHRTRNLSIAFGILGPLFALLLILLILYLRSRRNKQKHLSLAGSPSPPMTQPQFQAHSTESERRPSRPASNNSYRSAYSIPSHLPQAITTEFGPYVPYTPSRSPTKTVNGPAQNPKQLPNLRPLSPLDERVIMGNWRGVYAHRPGGRPSPSHDFHAYPGRRHDNYF